MTEVSKRWWANPQGIVAAITIATAILGFFYVRERQLWEHHSQIINIEERGMKAIDQANDRFERMEATVTALRDQINFLERRMDRIEVKQKDFQGNAVP
jgi:hypothetical protein